MLRHLLLITPSGIVLVKHEFQRLASLQPGLTGSLLAAMLDLCTKSVHLPLSFIELSTVAVSLAVDTAKTGMICAIFTDVEDGADFGTLLATEVLARFLREYADSSESRVVDTSAYNSFHTRLPDCLKGTAKRVMTELSNSRGISSCLLVHQDNVLHQSSPVDELGLVANLSAMLSTTRDIMALPEDRARMITVQGRKSNFVICPLTNGSIVVTLKKAALIATVQQDIDHASVLVDRVFRLLASLQGHAA